MDAPEQVNDPEAQASAAGIAAAFVATRKEAAMNKRVENFMVDDLVVG